MLPQSSVMFVSKAGVDTGAVESYNLKKRVEIVKHCRTVTKHDMKFNNAMPEMRVDPELFVSWPLAVSGRPALTDAACRCGWREMRSGAGDMASTGAAALCVLVQIPSDSTGYKACTGIRSRGSISDGNSVMCSRSNHMIPALDLII